MVTRDVFHTTLVHDRHQVSCSKMSILVEGSSTTATCYHDLVILTKLQPSMVTVLLSVCCLYWRHRTQPVPPPSSQG